jgi:hypothetical protein
LRLVAIFWLGATCAVPARAIADTPPSATSDQRADSVWRNVHDFFTWKHGEAGVYPTFAIDVGRKSTAGAALFVRQLLHPANQARLSVAAGTDGLVEAHGLDRFELDPRGSVQLRAHYRRRPDAVFYGLGAQTRDVDKTFFRLEEPELALGFRRALGRLSGVRAELAYRWTDLGGSDFSAATPSITQRFGGAGQPPLPPGWPGYSLLQGQVGWTFDSRGERPIGSGLRLGVDARYGVDPGDTAMSFLDWGADLGGYLDLSGRGHRLGLELFARSLEKLGDRDIPFTELPALGGRSRMRAFLPGRLRGPGAYAGTLSYQQPIGRLAEGELFFEVGNVVDGGPGDLGVRDLFGSYGMRLESTFSRDVSVGLLAGFGTSRSGGSDFVAAEEVRLSVGVNHNF